MGFITASKKKITVSANFCLAFIISANQLRFIYFDNEETLQYWHTEILRRQGFLDKRIEQYVPISNLGEGSFGLVVLSKHKFSDVKVAVKVIKKSLIEESFMAND